MTKPVWHGLVSCLGIKCPQKNIPDCVRFIIDVLCYNFKSQTDKHRTALC